MFGSKWSSQEQLVAQDWIERASRKTQLGRHCNCCPRLCYKRACVESLYMYCGALFLISLALFIILAAGIVAPFHKSLDFVVTRCTTLSSTITGKPQVLNDVRNLCCRKSSWAFYFKLFDSFCHLPFFKYQEKKILK